MIKKITVIAGLLLALVGLLGFVAPDVMSLHLSTSQSFLYLLSGAAALFFGLAVPPVPARTFSLVLGTFYTVLGLAGLGLGGPVNTLTIVPGHLAFETEHHLFHLFLGTVVLAVGLSSRIATPIPRPSANK